MHMDEVLVTVNYCQWALLQTVQKKLATTWSAHAPGVAEVALTYRSGLAIQLPAFLEQRLQSARKVTCVRPSLVFSTHQFRLLCMDKLHYWAAPYCQCSARIAALLAGVVKVVSSARL